MSNFNTCEQCDKQFQPSKRHPNQKFCDAVCLKKWENKNAYSPHEYVCKHCGITYQAKKKASNQYCSHHCHNMARMKTRGISLVWVKVCPLCGKHTQGNYCSDDCRKEIARIKARERDASLHKPKQIKCKCCGIIFTTVYGSKRRMFCGDDCLKKYNTKNSKQKWGTSFSSRARKKLRDVYGQAWQAYYEPINRNKVFERDMWTCQACGCKVESTKDYVEHQATVDHIVPLASGGPHWYDNVQTLCIMCNSIKSDREWTQIAKMIAS